MKVIVLAHRTLSNSPLSLFEHSRQLRYRFITISLHWSNIDMIEIYQIRFVDRTEMSNAKIRLK